VQKKTKNGQTLHSTVSHSDDLNAFLDSEEGRQIPDAEWLANLLREHRVAIRAPHELFTFAENHPNDFQVLTEQEVAQGVESTDTISRKYWDSDWLQERQPGRIRRLCNMDGSPLEWRRPGSRFTALVNKQERSDPPRHDGTFNAFLEFELSRWIVDGEEDELVLNVVQRCGMSGMRIRHLVELEQVRTLLDFPDGLPSLDTMPVWEKCLFLRRQLQYGRMPMWQKYLLWKRQLQYGRRLPDRKYGVG
jgi:hypothetical protein